jgi:hypothetical protein
MLRLIVCVRCRVRLLLQEVNEIIAGAQAELLHAAATGSGGGGSISQATASPAAVAETAGDAGGSVEIPPVTLSGGNVLRFEIRFGNAAISDRMPTPPSSGIVQVNLDDHNTRVVERYPDSAAAAAAAKEPYTGR